MEDGYDKPVAFASRTMSKAERNYGQVEKEGLSVVGEKVSPVFV